MGATDFIPGDWREWRRLRALELKRQGWFQRAIANALGVSEVSISHWLARASDGGSDALRARPAPGVSRWPWRPAKGTSSLRWMTQARA